MPARSESDVRVARITWPDTVKGIAILWIVFFHGFKEFRIDRYPWPLDPGYWDTLCGACANATELATCSVKAVVVAASSVGFHCVGVFILLSGFTLGVGAARRHGRVDWRAWYRSRLTRLFPLYWTAHLIYLVSPSRFHLEAIDYRFVLSFFGDRLIPLNDVFLYANPAWWFFGLLLQLYLVFPLLFEALRRAGAYWFLGGVALLTMLTRYLVLFPWASEYSESLLLGAMFTSRLFEFAAGIVLATAFVRDPNATTGWLRRPLTAVLGAMVYGAGIYSYGLPLAYIATDALIGCGLTALLAAAALRIDLHAWLRAPLARVGMYSYGLYLLHQPYMIWLGTTLKGASLALFLPIDAAVVVVLAAIAMVIEKRVNALVVRVIG